MKLKHGIRSILTVIVLTSLLGCGVSKTKKVVHRDCGRFIYVSIGDQDILYHSGMTDDVISYLKPLTESQEAAVKRIRNLALLDNLAEQIQNVNDKHMACMEQEK